MRACDLLLAGVDRLLEVLQRRAPSTGDTVMVGRTHGIHAEPYTLGLKLVGWHAEMTRNRDRLRRAREEIRYGKLSGAVGTYAHLDPVDRGRGAWPSSGSHPEPVATQVVPRDRHAAFMSLPRRSWRRRSIASPPRSATSSAPTSARSKSRSPRGRRAPRRCRTSATRSAARTSRAWPASCAAHVQAALENVPLWHERDISHSSVERVILPDATTPVRLHAAPHDRHPRRPASSIRERMAENMDRMKGLDLLAVRPARAGPRPAWPARSAYAIVQRNAMRVWAREGGFHELLAADPEVTRR